MGMNDKAAPQFSCSRRGFLLGTATTAADGDVRRGDYVVTQPEEGVFKAWSVRCPHQGGRINAVRDGVMICPDHNSHFDIDTGDVVSGPSRHPAGAAPMAADDGDLVVG